MMSSIRNRDYLFVYGTLRKDISNQMSLILAQHADFVGEGTFRGKLYDLGDYPGAVPSNEASDLVKGDVYALPNQKHVLRILDEYEGCGPDEFHPTEFRRERYSVDLNNGKTVDAWIYIYNRSTDGLEAIPSGDYLVSRER